MTISADDGAEIYYHYTSLGDSRYTYSAHFHWILIHAGCLRSKGWYLQQS